MVFQYTDKEIAGQGSFVGDDGWEEGRVKSFLFLAVELRRRDYS